MFVEALIKSLPGNKIALMKVLPSRVLGANVELPICARLTADLVAPQSQSEESTQLPSERYRRRSRRTVTNALGYRADEYQRLQRDLGQFKGSLASGYPFVFGFTV